MVLTTAHRQSLGRRRRLGLIGSLGLTLRSPGTPAIGLGEVLLIPGGFAELLGRRGGRLQRLLIMTACVWAVGSAVSDVVNDRPEFDLLRGQARIWLLLFGLLGARRLMRTSGLTTPQIVGAYAIGSLIAAVLLPAPSYSVDPWKFGLSLPLCLLVLLFVNQRSWAIRCSTTVALSGLNFALGYRSLGGVLLLALTIQLFRAVPWHHRRGRVTPLLLASVLMLYGLTIAYEEAVRAGLFGEQTTKFETQLDGEVGLLSGRIGTIAALDAIADRPIVGWGTWANDPDLIQTYVQAVVDNHGEAFTPAREPGRFPAHSYLLQGWVESGLSAVPFWLLTAFVASRALRRSLFDPDPRTSWLLLDFLAMKFAWDFAFSPYGAETRGLVAVSLLAFLATIDVYREAEQRAWSEATQKAPRGPNLASDRRAVAAD